LARPLRSRCGSAPTVAAAGSGNADSDDCCEESGPALNANPGNSCEEPPLLVPETKPIRIATAQTKIAVIHAIRTATRPANLASDVPFTRTSVVAISNFEAGGLVPQGGADACPSRAPISHASEIAALDERGALR
jgi:hypothetical protein